MPLPQDIRPVFQDIQDTLFRADEPWIGFRRSLPYAERVSVRGRRRTVQYRRKSAKSKPGATTQLARAGF